MQGKRKDELANSADSLAEGRIEQNKERNDANLAKLHENIESEHAESQLDTLERRPNRGIANKDQFGVPHLSYLMVWAVEPQPPGTSGK